MLEIRPNCEHCNKDLAPGSNEAMICSFECTYCTDCALNALEGRCPNCGGELKSRPIRPASELERHPASKVRVFNPERTGKQTPDRKPVRETTVRLVQDQAGRPKHAEAALGVGCKTRSHDYPRLILVSSRSSSAAANRSAGEIPNNPEKRLRGKVDCTVLYFMTSSL